MSVEKLQSQTSEQAAYLAQKRKELEDEENKLITDRARAGRDREKALKAEQEKTEDAVVKISKEAEKQLELTRKTNSERLRLANENSQKSYEQMSAQMAEQLKQIDAETLKKLSDYRASSLEKLKSVESRGEDPFYRMKSFSPEISEKNEEYQVKIRLPQHEAKNLFISSENNKTMKLSLARSFSDRNESEDKTQVTRTSNYQTILETVQLPGAFDSKSMKREYADGVLTIRAPKLT